MGNKTTSRWRRVASVALLLSAGCDLGDDPDPRAYTPSPFPLAAKSWQPTLPVVAEVDAPAAPAPQFESSRPPAGTMAGAHPVTVAVGHNAQQVLDGQLERCFTEQQCGTAHSFTSCTDRDAVELLLTGRIEFAVIGDQLSTRELRAGLQQTRLGLELFAVAVAPDAPVRSLTRSQVRQIFTGEVTDWMQLGLTGGAIVPVVPSDPKLAGRAARTLIPGDAFGTGVVRVASERHVADQMLHHKGAIGIVRVTDQAPSGMKLLAIDWCQPTVEAFAYGTYPFGVPIHLVTAGPAIGEALRFLEFTRSDAARAVLASKLSLP